MTGSRPGGASQVYAIYGHVDPRAVSMADLRERGAVLHQIPLDDLVSLQTASPALRREALAAITQRGPDRLVGAVGYDDYWTTALDILNGPGPHSAARRLVTDKAALYARFTERGVPVTAHLVGDLSTTLLADAVATLGPRPVLKPARGAGSRGVYRYRADLTSADNLALYRGLLRVGNIDSATPTLAMEYIGGDPALEVSAEAVIVDGNLTHLVVHEKVTASTVPPFVDRVMVSPPTQPDIVAALPAVYPTIGAVAAALDLTDGVLHVELRLHQGLWHPFDVGVRPGSGLVAHSALALTGADPRLLHLLACLGGPLSTAAAGTRPTHAATRIACCYVPKTARPTVTLTAQGPLVEHLRTAPEVIGWHLNAAETTDDVYLPDAGLSVGVGAPDPRTATARLASIIQPYGYTTT